MENDKQPSNPLEAYRITTVPAEMYYIPNFASADECNAILAKIPANRWISLSRRRLQAHPSQLTKNQTLLPGPLPDWLTDSPAPILRRFEELGVFAGCHNDAAAINAHNPSRAMAKPNHVLVNEYMLGQGIMPHEDGPAYWPVVATISLGSTIVLDLYDKASEDGTMDTPSPEHVASSVPRYRILQEPGSLLVTRGDAYSTLLHGISEVEVDENLDASSVANWDLLLLDKDEKLQDGKNVRGTRVSLTYRIVRNVSKINMAMLGIGSKKF